MNHYHERIAPLIRTADPRGRVITYRYLVVEDWLKWTRARQQRDQRSLRMGRKLRRKRFVDAQCVKLFGHHQFTIERWHRWLQRLGADAILDALQGRPVREWVSLRSTYRPRMSDASAQLRAAALEMELRNWQAAVEAGREVGVPAADITRQLGLKLTTMQARSKRYAEHGRLGLVDARTRRRLSGTLTSE